MSNDKKTLRADLRRRLPPPEARSALSSRIRSCLRADPAVRRAQTLALFLPLPDEVDLADLAAEFLQSGRRVAVPALDAGTGEWTWRRLHSLTEVERSACGPRAPQPAGADSVRAEEIDLVLVPARAVDARGNRLGRGAGIYDRLLQGTGARRVAVVFASQVLDALPVEPHDVPVHAVVTETGMREFPDTTAE